MSQLFYRLLLIGVEGESVAFRKPSGLLFPSPAGTSYNLPISGLGLYYVCGHHHLVTPESEIMYMDLGDFGTKPEYFTDPRINCHIIEIERDRLLKDGWEELDEEDVPIKRR